MRTIDTRIFQSAALCTHPSICTSVFHTGTHHTLTTVRNTDCTIRKYFNFNTHLTCLLNDLNWCFSSKNNSFNTLIFHEFNAFEIMNVHLCRTMNRHIWITGSNIMKQSKILNQNCITVIFIQKVDFFFCIFYFRFIKHCIDRTIDFYISCMTIMNGFYKFFMRKVSRKRSCRKRFQSEIYCITPCIDCCF